MKALKSLFSKYSAKDRELIEAIRNIFGFSPKNIAPYQLACRHKSVARAISNGSKISNERLEFLGDAILGAIVAEYLFKKFPLKDEGFLTEIRSRIVSRNTLNTISMRLGLNKLVKTISKSSKSDTSIPGDALEAFIGAIYLDKGYEFTREIIINKIISYNIDLDELIATEVNFKSKLIEWGQKEKRSVNFKLVEESETSRKLKLYLINVEVDNQVMGKGEEYSIKRAEQVAAEMAWSKICN